MHRLVDDGFLAEVGAKETAGFDGGVNGEFEIAATARAGHSLQELYDVIVEELAKAATAPPATHEL